MDPSSPFDFTSELFDPVQTLQSNSIVLPYPKAKTYNNIAEYYSHTFLKCNKGVSKKTSLSPKKRNYSYYLDTIGVRGIRAVRYMQYLERRRKTGKALKRKPRNVTYTPGSPLRSDKIINLESNFSEYWKRKRRLFENAKAVPDIAGILKKSDDIPLFQKIKSLAKPLTAQELIAKAKQEASSTPCGAKVSCTFPVDKQQVSSRAKFGPSTSATTTDYLSDDSSGTEELQRFCHYYSRKIARNPVYKQTSQSKDFLGVTNPVNCDRMSKDLQSNCVNSSVEKQIDSPLTTTENILRSSKKVKSSCNRSKKKVKVISKKTPKKVQPSQNTLKKENCELLLKNCTCYPKISMGSHCSCGVYTIAMNNVLKFKIPRKKKSD